MGGEGYGGSEGGGQQLLRGGELAGGSVGEQCGGGNADEGVESAPDEVESGDFVGEEFDGEQECAGGDYGPGFQELQRRREGDVSEAS